MKTRSVPQRDPSCSKMISVVRSGADRDSFEGAASAHARSPLSCGSIVYMLPKSRRGRVSARASSEMTFTKTSTEVLYSPTRLWGFIHAVAVRPEPRGDVSEPRTAPRREQKADFRLLMSGTVDFLPSAQKRKRLNISLHSLFPSLDCKTYSSMFKNWVLVSWLHISEGKWALFLLHGTYFLHLSVEWNCEIDFKHVSKNNLCV